MINRSAHSKRRAYAGWQKPAVLGLIDSEATDTIDCTPHRLPASKTALVCHLQRLQRMSHPAIRVLSRR